jgi:hypothetical protein
MLAVVKRTENVRRYTDTVKEIFSDMFTLQRDYYMIQSRNQLILVAEAYNQKLA